MFQEPPREQRWQSWLFFISWSAFIWRLAPLTRPVLNLLGGFSGVLVYLTIAVTVIAAALGVIYVIRQPRIRSFPSFVAMVLVVGGYAWICLRELKAPQEALHFLEYGFLGLLAFRALSHDLRDKAVYPSAVLLCALVGNVDEFLQWLMPDRLWDIRDWAMDAAAAALAQMAIAGGMRPPFIRWHIAPRSILVLLRLLTAQAAMMLVCLSITPARSVWLGSRVSGLRFLTWHANVMTEYGYLHHVPDVGSFYSRFTRAQLKELDRTRYDDAAELIRQYKSGPGYRVFLREINSGVDPFTHEAYVHINRRNHYEMASFKYRGRDDAAYRYHCRVAYRENQILEMFFPKTMGFAGEALTPWEYTRLRNDMDGEPYTSAVSEHLITEVTEGQLRAVFLFLIIAFVVADYGVSRHARQNA